MNIRNIIKESIDNVVFEKEVYQSVDRAALKHLCHTKETNYKAMQNDNPAPMPDVDLAVKCGRFVKYPEIDVYDMANCYDAIINAIDVLSNRPNDGVFKIMLVYEDGRSKLIGEVRL